MFVMFHLNFKLFNQSIRYNELKNKITIVKNNAQYLVADVKQNFLT